MRVSSASRQCESTGPRKRTTARMSSWPSRNTSAETVTVSPTQRLTAKRPSSIAGDGYWITIRDGDDRALEGLDAALAAGWGGGGGGGMCLQVFVEGGPGNNPPSSR